MSRSIPILSILTTLVLSLPATALDTVVLRTRDLAEEKSKLE